MKMTKTSALEYSGCFLREERSELHSWCYSRVPQRKNWLGAKNTFTRQALLDLERCGV
jgi:hypothetical protein